MDIQRVKIYGAGSIGNHLANASRTLGAEVVVCDLDPAALARMRDEIYPSRYGAWDDGITLTTPDTEPKGGFDLICVGTPPDAHLPIAMAALDEKPRALQIEKPLCPPDLIGAQELWEKAESSGVKAFVGYDHVVGTAARKAQELLDSGTIGKIETLDVEFREFWGGIFAAHPWLSGPSDTYLGFWERGGGASGEHSHALNLWQHLSHYLGQGRVTEVDGMLQYEERDGARYDSICLLQLRTETGFTGRVVQDVVTQPVKKVARVQGDKGTLEWINGYNAKGDAVIVSLTGQTPETHEVPKTRPDDFIEELRHIGAHLTPGAPQSPISLRRGLDTMLVVAAAHASEARKSRITLDYGK